MQKPERKHNELLEQLDTLLYEPNEFTLRRIEREANALIKSDAAYAYMVLGVVASLRPDLAKIDEFFNKALALSNDPVIRGNYVVSLGRVGRYADALKIIDSFPSLNTDPSMLRDGLQFLRSNGDYERGLAYCERLAKMKTEPEDDSDLSNSKVFFNLMAQSGLSSQQVQTYHDLANRVLHEFNILLHTQTRSMWANDSWLEGQPSIIHDIYVKSPYAADMEWRLAELLADSSESSLCSGNYSIHFHQLKH